MANLVRSHTDPSAPKSNKDSSRSGRHKVRCLAQMIHTQIVIPISAIVLLTTVFGSRNVADSLTVEAHNGVTSLDFVSNLRKGLIVNVTVENLAPCKKLVRVEVEA